MAASSGSAAKRGPSSEAAARDAAASAGSVRHRVGGDSDAPMRRLQQALGNQAMVRVATSQRDALAAARAPGRPLDPAVRHEMEGRFGEDLGSVRVRTDRAACDAVGANAYALGDRIVFNAGRYAPQRQAGRALLAHELTHVIQQRRGAGGASSAGLEGEARGAGRTVAFDSAPVAVTGRAPVGVARDTPATPPVPLPTITEFPLEGTTTLYIDGTPVLRFPTANAAKVRRIAYATSEHPDTIYFGVSATSDSGARVDQAALDQLSFRYKIVAQLETRGVSVAEQDGGIGIDLGQALPAPPLKPVPPVAKPRPAPHKKPPVAAKLEELPPPTMAAPQLEPPAADTASPQAAVLSPSLSGPTPDGEQVVVTAAPTDLSDRLATIRRNLKNWTFNFSWEHDIVASFKDLSPADFQRLQDELTEDEMTDVFDQLPAFYSTLIGTYGTVTKGRDKLNQNRVDFIENIRRWGSSKDVFYRWAFASMSRDDMHVVLAKLADDKRLHETVLTVEGLADNLQARGIAPSELQEDDPSGPTRVGRKLGDIWSSAWSSTIFADGPGFEYSYLPKNYQHLYVDNLTQGFEQAATLPNIARGAASNITLGFSDIPFTVYDASKLTVGAAQDLWEGKTGAAAEKLTPVVVMLLLALGGRRIARIGAPPSVVALEESKALAPLEGATLAEPATVPPVAGGASEWEVRKVGQTAEGAAIHVARHPNGELIEIVVDPKTQTVRATHLGTGEVVTWENGQYTRGTPPQLTAGEGASVPQSPQPPQPSSTPPLALPPPRSTPLQPARPAAPLGRLPPAPQPLGLFPLGPQPLRLLPPGPQPFGLLTPGEPPSALSLAPDARAIPGTPGVVVGGSSQALGKNLLETYGLARRQKFSGWQPHHLIPTEAAGHPVIVKIGMQLDHPTNGIMLPEPGVGWSGRLPTHQGYHSLFSNIALDELDKIDVTLPVPQLQLKVFGVQWRLRLAVEEGLPLYYSKGGTELDWQRSLLSPVPR